MPVHEPPLTPLSAEDLRDAQRPFLLGWPAGLGTHTLDRHENDEIPRVVSCHDLLLERAGLEEPRHGRPILARSVEAAYGRSAERRHEREVLRVLDQREVTIDVAAHERRVRLC